MKLGTCGVFLVAATVAPAATGTSKVRVFRAEHRATEGTFREGRKTVLTKLLFDSNILSLRQHVFFHHVIMNERLSQLGDEGRLKENWPNGEPKVEWAKNLVEGRR